MAVTRQTSTSLIAFSPDQKMLDRENWEDAHLLNIVIIVVRSLHYHTKYLIPYAATLAVFYLLWNSTLSPAMGAITNNSSFIQLG